MKVRASILIVAVVSALSACVVETPAHARTFVDIEVAPPPPRVIEVPPPRRGYVYAPGYWSWNGHKHVWVEGRYIRERRGEHWVPAHWEERHGRYHFEQGHWEH